jgi:hypothetical protein
MSFDFPFVRLFEFGNFVIILIFIEKDRTNIPESRRSFILKEIKFEH